MQIATGKTVISPAFPIKAIGYAQQVAPMEQVRDPLHARLLLLQEGEISVLLCALDLLYCPRSLTHRLEAALAGHWGGRVHVIPACTHTHFGPDVHDKTYAAFLHDRIVTAALALTPHEAELTCGYAWAPYAEVGQSRISRWHTDRVLAHTLCLYEEGRRVATLCIHNCHPTVLDGETPFFTAEYPGVAMGELEDRHPGEFFAFLQGAAGDVSTRFTRSGQTVEQMEAFGHAMAGEFERLMTRAAPAASLTLALRDWIIPFTHDLKNPEDLVIPDYYSERERKTLEYGIAASRENLAHPERLQADAWITRLELGPYRLVFCGNELFSEYSSGLDDDRAALVCYTRGDGAYIAGPSFDGMTYETLQDTLSDESRRALLAAITEAGR